MKFTGDCSLSIAFNMWYDQKHGECLVKLPEKDKLDFNVGLEIYQAHGISEKRRFMDLNNFDDKIIKVSETVAYEDIYFVNKE